MVPDPSTRRALALLALLLAAVLASGAAPADARAPPWPVCGLCDGDTLADAAAERGVDVETGGSTLDVRAFENASTRWTARVDLTDGADAMANDSFRRGVVSTVVDRRGDARAVSSRMDGDTLVVDYWRDDAVVRRLGVVLFTPLHASDPPLFTIGGEGTAYPGADELVVHAPDGYVVAGGAGDGSVDDRTVRWADEEGGEDGIDRGALPTFVAEDAPLPGVRVSLARLLTGY